MTAFPKMDPKIKAAWVKDLRSGIPQAHARLAQRAEGTNALVAFCCLGRLCVVAKADFYPDWTLPPDSTLKQVGLSAEAAEELWRMNDGVERPKKNFPAIADWVEQNL